MPKIFWRSLRSRILLLVVLTFLFLAAAAISLFTFLRNRHAETLSLTEHHLVSLAANLARNYADHRTADSSLRAIEPGPPPPPTPAPAPHPERDGPPPKPDLLKGLTAETLQHEDGVEGGFYAARADALIGYAFPTHEGPGAEKGMPERERPTIENLAREAVAANAIKTFRFEGPHDAILFVAAPIHEPSRANEVAGGADEVTGAAWLMERLPGIEGGQSRELLFGSVGFGIAALMTALLAVFVTTEIRSGVNIVLQRLGSLEGGLPAATQQMTGRPPLEEFDRVLHGIDSLALTLQEKIENERTLESQVRHNERLSALGQFAAGIAHELRNPLGTIRMRTQMWQRSTDAEAARRSSAVILEEIDRLDTIISRLLYFARPIQLQLRPVSLDDLCAVTASTWADKETAKGIQIVCKAASHCVVTADRGRLLQVLDNLMENAVHSASHSNSQAGRVTISTALEADFARIDIMDDGRGFTPAALRHAMDPFYTTKDTGTGLGLSISFEIVQAHGGELLLANHEGGGAVASLRLPLDREDRDTLRQADEEAGQDV
ncbi:sensor histidine kinase [Tunturiibacter gelidoferens]|uniref:Signal transduction histidine kinase n=1 Tax=Tunturiibacter gelidiferens TaxID=3069689 RepID=A0ACC5P3R7_9BACT|nr:ATP-binding protein [Edaphobacter lichenicola]MBB5341366.1 signal transduction histidine kinase [Edaphobacter lichenicola]